MDQESVDQVEAMDLDQGMVQDQASVDQVEAMDLHLELVPALVLVMV